jgi:hypothetical protein
MKYVLVIGRGLPSFKGRYGVVTREIPASVTLYEIIFDGIRQPHVIPEPNLVEVSKEEYEANQVLNE